MKIWKNRLSARDTQIDELLRELKIQTTEEKTMSERLPYIQKEDGADKKPMSDAKVNDIFDRIRELAEKKKIWADISLTRDSFAEMAGCNRTYLAEVLKTKTGMGYTQYMNSCRIREAITILSDPNDDVSLNDLYQKLGFLTIGNFHKVFKQQTGMSPAAFRKTARKL